MISDFKKHLLQLIFFALAIVFLLFLFVKQQPINSTDTHHLLTGELRELQSLDIKLSESVLQHHYQLFHNYDGVVTTMQRMQSLSSTLLQHLKNGLFPNTSEIKQALGEIQQLIKLKTSALEDFKSSNATSKTALIYLPTTVRETQKKLHDSDTLQHEKLNHLLMDTMLLVTSRGHVESETLSNDISTIEQAIPDFPEHIKASAILSLRYAKNILSNEKSIK